MAVSDGFQRGEFMGSIRRFSDKPGRHHNRTLYPKTVHSRVVKLVVSVNCTRENNPPPTKLAVIPKKE